MIEHGQTLSGMSLGAVELSTGASYMMILAGFGLRSLTEGKTVKLLWPWALMLIFGLCGLTRVIAFTQTPVADVLCVLLHLSLMTISMVYGIAQLLYAFWPEIFDEETINPKLVKVTESYPQVLNTKK